MNVLQWLGAVDRRAVAYWAAYLTGSFLLWMVFTVWVPAAQYQERVVKAKQNLHAIQLALERFAVDSPAGNYPADINELSSTGYLPIFPTNPFTGKPMQPVSAGDPPGAGDFLYCPKGDYVTNAGPPIGYELQLFY